MAGALISLVGLVKSFGGVRAVDGVSLDVRAGEFLSLLGASGCGKTTLLRLIAGLDRPDAGRIIVESVDMTDRPAYARPVNTVFQSYALFPHLTVAGNVAFGLRQERLGRAEIRARAQWAMELVRLDDLGRRRIDELSGGQRQRVAIARAIAKRPKILLLDEPLAALDRRLREATRFELMALRQRLGITFVLVTHDQEEAMAMSDRIVVMDGGRFAQIGTPREIYERPESRFVAAFIGDANLIDGVVERVDADVVAVRAAGIPEPILIAPGARDARFPVGAPVTVVVRPEQVGIDPAAGARGGRLKATMEAVAYQGSACVTLFRLANGQPFRALWSAASTHPLVPGAGVEIGWAAGDARLVAR